MAEDAGTPTGDNSIMQYVNREERREHLHRDALEAWVDFQKTGLHATTEEVDAWLAGFEEKDDMKLPASHT